MVPVVLMAPIESEHDITELLWGAKALAVMAAWNQLGHFEALAAGPTKITDLPGDERGLRITASVLAHLGLIIGDGERYTLSITGRQLLEAGQLPTTQNLDVLRDHAKMVDVLRDGGPVRDDDGESKGTTGGVVPESRERSAAFLDMLFRRSETSAKQVFDWIGRLLPDGGKVLDLGGGHGRYGRVFADEGYPATLIDLPLVIDLAKERHGDQLSYRSGNFLEPMDLGGPYDLILLSNIVHGQCSEENHELVGRLAQVMSKGGFLVLKDMFLDERGRDPRRAAFFGMTMLFYTDRGRSFSLREAERWCEDAGLGQFDVITLESHELLVARKPA